MYKTMLDMHKAQVRRRQEQGELDYAFRELKAVRRSISFKRMAEAMQQEADERRKRWRAYRYR